MLKKFLLFTIASLVMLPALAAKPTDKPDKGNKDGAGVPLDVVFRDYHYDNQFPFIPGDKFGSDGFTDGESIPYLDGDEQVSTHIGKFRFGLNVGMNGPRNFYLDFSGCKPVMPCTPPDLIGGLTTGWNVFATSPDRAQYLEMTVGETKEVDFQLEFPDANGKGWRIMFNPSKCPKDINGDDLATMATVTKIDDDAWEFEATADDDVACLQLREGGAKHWTFHGLYSLPFQITAIAQP